MRTDVRQLERPVRDATDRADDREDEMSTEIRELILSFGKTDRPSDDDSEGALQLASPETSVSE
jgi:hypothetical protein